MGEYGEYLHRGLRKVDAIVNKIIMTRNYPDKASLAFLLVEGTTDKILYQNYVNTSVCQIIVVDGKDNAREVLTILDHESFPGALAIVDADFDVLAGRVPRSPNILITDTHDLETMLLQSPALEKVLTELGSEDKIAKFVATRGQDIRSLLLESARPIGYLRWLSIREALSLKFEDMGFEKFVEKDTLRIDTSKLVRYVLSKSSMSNSQKRPLDTDIHNKIKQLSNDVHDLWHVCCGHDITYLLTFGLRKVIGTKNLEPDMVEICLRLAYEHSYFRQTKLYLLFSSGKLQILRLLCL